MRGVFQNPKSKIIVRGEIWDFQRKGGWVNQKTICCMGGNIFVMRGLYVRNSIVYMSTSDFPDNG